MAALDSVRAIDIIHGFGLQCRQVSEISIGFSPLFSSQDEILCAKILWKYYLTVRCPADNLRSNHIYSADENCRTFCFRVAIFDD